MNYKVALRSLCSHNYIDQLIKSMPYVYRPRTRFLVRDILNTQIPLVIHFQFLTRHLEFFLIAALAKVRNIPLVWTPHDLHPEHQLGKDYPLISTMLKLVDAIIVLSRKNKAEIESLGIAADKIFIFPLPNLNFWHQYKISSLLARKKLGIPDNHTVFLQFGPVLPYKGYDLTSEAFLRVYQRYDKTTLLLGGKILDQKLYNKITSLANTKFCLPDRYLTHEEVGLLYSAADVVLYPYKEINQSGAIFDALAFGKPMIVSNLGGIPEVIKDGREGFLISPTATDLTAKMTRFIKNRKLIKIMGDKSYKNSYTRTWEETSKAHRELYEYLLSPKKP